MSKGNSTPLYSYSAFPYKLVAFKAFGSTLEVFLTLELFLSLEIFPTLELFLLDAEYLVGIVDIFSKVKLFSLKSKFYLYRPQSTQINYLGYKLDLHWISPE